MQQSENLMTEHRMTVGAIALEQAIRTVVRDLRIPQKLRTALAVYQDQRSEINMLRDGRTDDPTCLPKTIRHGLAQVYQSRNSPNGRHEQSRSLIREPPSIEQEIKICLWHNDESLDWSVEINGQHHEHVSSEILEALVECALILAQISLTRAFAHQPQ
jgi:hypothetical protein